MEAIAMKKEVLHVSHELISVDYEFINASTIPRFSSVSFYPAASKTASCLGWARP
jgi:hypothetical protein